MTTRRTLGAGPQDPAAVRAAQADLLDELPGIRLPDLRNCGRAASWAPARRSSRVGAEF
ncbi:hypothetical protein ACIQKB_36885 [Streptomyces sp. NPDC092046]|uniref:hypothetical protein n=1 Tax=Streptomyces sp. NPDC092046 TaxID=3366009 RepID=UPI00381167E0